MLFRSSLTSVLIGTVADPDRMVVDDIILDRKVDTLSLLDVYKRQDIERMILQRRGTLVEILGVEP